MSFLRTENVVKQYGHSIVLDNININVPRHSIYGLLGPNGAGKTTLIRIITQITAPDSGAVYLDGKLLKPQDVGRISYLPEERGLYKKMKIGEQALYLAQLKGMTKNDALKSLKYWFEKFEIQPWWDKKVEELSKGMQQKVQFVTTIVHNPELLIFDEPFSGFDPINANLLKNEILELKEKGATIIFSTHNMASVEELCDSITLINRSKAILSGEVSHIKNNYKQNHIQLKLSGDLHHLPSILPAGSTVIETKTAHNHHSVTIKIDTSTTINQLINCIIGTYQIHGLQERLPSMNDIFISLVEENNTLVSTREEEKEILDR